MTSMVHIKRITTTILHILICFAIFASVWGYSEKLTDTMITPKWVFCLSGVLMTMIWYSVVRLFGVACYCSIASVRLCFVVAVCSEVMLFFFQWIGISIKTFSCNGTGSFDNPAGFASCMSIGTPFVAYFLCNQRKWVRTVVGLLSLTICVAVTLSGSRAGFISIMLLLVCWVYQKAKNSTKQYRVILLPVFFFLLVCSYFAKKDSADGRLLIWRCSIELIGESPLVGYGIGGFEANYMDVQAEYFRTGGINNRFAILASNIKNPFNEYLHLLLTFGITGLIPIAGFIMWLRHRYQKYPSKDKRMAFYVLLSTGVFSLFSYPFTYPFTWITTIFSGYIIARGNEWTIARTKLKYIILILVLGGSAFGGATVYQCFNMEAKWRNASNLVLQGHVNDGLQIYGTLIQLFDKNPYFLYNYAAILQENGRYRDSQTIAEMCCRYWSDYDLELIMGDNAKQMKEFKKAEKHYLQAYHMCPSRFLPPYKLLQLYKEIGDRYTIKGIAQQILSMPVKRKTSTINYIKKDAESAMK